MEKNKGKIVVDHGKKEIGQNLVKVVFPLSGPWGSWDQYKYVLG